MDGLRPRKTHTQPHPFPVQSVYAKDLAHSKVCSKMPFSERLAYGFRGVSVFRMGQAGRRSSPHRQSAPRSPAHLIPTHILPAASVRLVMQINTHLHDEGQEGNHGQAAVLELGERPVLADAVGGEAEGVEANV